MRRKSARRRAVRRAAWSGSSFWSSVVVAEFALRHVRQQIKKQPEYLTTDKVLIGQSLSVSSIEPTTRRDKRRARKAAKAAGTGS